MARETSELLARADEALEASKKNRIAASNKTPEHKRSREDDVEYQADDIIFREKNDEASATKTPKIKL